MNSYVNSFLAFKWYTGVTSVTITQNYCPNTCQFNDMNLPYPKGDFANLKMTL